MVRTKYKVKCLWTLRRLTGWGAGGLIRSHGSLARSIPHSSNLLYVLNLPEEKYCKLQILKDSFFPPRIKSPEQSTIIVVYCTLGLETVVGSLEKSGERRLEVILEEFPNPITFLRPPGIRCDRRSILGNSQPILGKSGWSWINQGEKRIFISAVENFELGVGGSTYQQIHCYPPSTPCIVSIINWHRR